MLDFVIVGASFLLRWVVSLGPYSGKNTPPLFGDYEAQRHWMELTLHQPLSKWYFFDLEYWVCYFILIKSLTYFRDLITLHSRLTTCFFVEKLLIFSTHLGLLMGLLEDSNHLITKCS